MIECTTGDLINPRYVIRIRPKTDGNVNLWTVCGGVWTTELKLSIVRLMIIEDNL